MYRKLLYSLLIIVMALSLSPASYANLAAAQPVAKPISPLPMSGVHLIAPRDGVVLDGLFDKGLLKRGASEEEIKSAVQKYREAFAKKSSTWVNPKAAQWALQRENELSAGEMRGASAVQPVTASVFALAVDFSNASETVYVALPNEAGDACVNSTLTQAGPRQGQVPAPAKGDNNTLWYTAAQTANAKFYENLIFGYKGAGRVRMDLRDPRDHKKGINLKGVTVQDYYDHIAGKGNVLIKGAVEGWVTVDHSEAYYGASPCNKGSLEDGDSGAFVDATYASHVPVAQLVIDAVNKFAAANPAYDWSQFDGDGDGFIDTFWFIHAGMGEEEGGGAQGGNSIWSHSSDLRFYGLVDGYTIPGTTYKIGPYTMQPEMAGVGVFAEEFGHNFFNLPDLYTTDLQGSIGFWSIMEAGAWGGYLGGAQPVGMPLWFKMIATCGVDGSGNPIYCNWQAPMKVRNYTDPKEKIIIGQLEQTPKNKYTGVRINLPENIVDYENVVPGGTGNAAYTDSGIDQTNFTLTHDLNVTDNTLTVKSKWSIEEGWDYGYVQIYDTVDAQWECLADTTGYMVIYDPNDQQLDGCKALTGEGDTAERVMTFDLSAYNGQNTQIRFLYVTDAASTWQGWWLDDIQLGGVTIADGDFEASDNTTDSFSASWTNSDPGWHIVPRTVSYPHYYLVEWRNNTKYDSMAKTAYITAESDENLWTVSRVPYNLPGALVYHRDTRFSNTYAMMNNMNYSPSFGPQYQLLLVDMNPMPITLAKAVKDGNPFYRYLDSRTSSYDAALTLQASKAFTIPKVKVVRSSGTEYYKNVKVKSKPAVKTFNDRKGYYPGFFYLPDYGLGFWNTSGSTVIPAQGDYSVAVTNFTDGKPAADLYGQTMSAVDPYWTTYYGWDWTLGSGNPGDEGMQYGVNIKLKSKMKAGSLAQLEFSYVP